MAVWYNVWSFGIFFLFWYVRAKKNLATLVRCHQKTFFGPIIFTQVQMGKKMRINFYLWLVPDIRQSAGLINETDFKIVSIV
jgi:hypothetical protein